MVVVVENDSRNHSRLLYGRPKLQTRATDLTEAAAPALVSTPEARVEQPPREPRGLSLPVVLGASTLVHGAVIGAMMLLPTHAVGIEPAPMELSIEIEAPAPPPPAPPPVEEVVEPPPPPPAAAVTEAAPPPRQERRVETVAEPAPPAPVLTGGEDGPADWEMDPGEEGGRLGGTPGGTGDGVGGPASEAAPEAAPVPTGPSRAELRARVMGYIRGLSGSLGGRVSYPLAARRAHLQGVVILRLRLAQDGRILGVRVSRTSGHDVLDDAALASVRDVGSLPAPPHGVPWDEERELPVPIRFQLQ